MHIFSKSQRRTNQRRSRRYFAYRTFERRHLMKRTIFALLLLGLGGLAAKNVTEAPLDLTARVALVSVGQPDIYEGAVKPWPLPPGKTGRFTIRKQIPGHFAFMQGECRLEPFRDQSGKRIKYGSAEPAR
jgi:hypothetical protein